MNQERDVREGADMLMVKPGLPYLDIVRAVKDKVCKQTQQCSMDELPACRLIYLFLIPIPLVPQSPFGCL